LALLIWMAQTGQPVLPVTRFFYCPFVSSGLRPFGCGVVDKRFRAWCDSSLLLAWDSAEITRERDRGASGSLYCRFDGHCRFGGDSSSGGRYHFGDCSCFGGGRSIGWTRTGPSSFGRPGLAFPLRKGRVDLVSPITSVVVVHFVWRGGLEETGCFGRHEVTLRKGWYQPLERACFWPLGLIGSPRVALHFGRAAGNRCSHRYRAFGQGTSTAGESSARSETVASNQVVVFGSLPR
jgi:hypothetical protein